MSDAAGCTTNQLARECADLRDENERLRQEVTDLYYKWATKSAAFDVMTLRMQEGGISEEEIRRLADAAWDAVDRAREQAAS